MPLTLPPVPDGVRLLKDDEAERLRQRFPNLAHGPERCITCRGKKTFRWYAPGTREVAEWGCNCVDQYILNRAMLAANIGLTYQRLGWFDMTHTEGPALDKVNDYLLLADEYIANGIGLILYGEMGTGKTALASLLLKNLLGRGVDVYFTTFSEMIDTYTGGWNDAAAKAWFHKRIKNAGVLVLDDVGREYQGRTKSGLPESTFDEVLRHRVAASTPTILTTNHDMTRMKEGYGGNVMSLLHERSTTYRFTGADVRDDMRGRVLDEVEAGLTRPVVLA